MSSVMALVAMLAMTGCADSDDAVSSDTTSTKASSEQANAESQQTQEQANAESQPTRESANAETQPAQDQANAELQPTQDPANVKPAPTGPQPTALPSQQLPYQGTDADGDGFYTVDEFQAAITGLFGYYDWPAGYMPDVRAITAGWNESQFADDGFQVLGEYTIVGLQFRCAWGQTWLDAFAGGDTATMDASIQNLRDELSLNPMYLPSTQENVKDMYDKASLGDPARLRQFVDVNCGRMEWAEDSGTPG